MSLSRKPANKLDSAVRFSSEQVAKLAGCSASFLKDLNRARGGKAALFSPTWKGGGTGKKDQYSFSDLLLVKMALVASESEVKKAWLEFFMFIARSLAAKLQQRQNPFSFEFKEFVFHDLSPDEKKAKLKKQKETGIPILTEPWTEHIAVSMSVGVVENLACCKIDSFQGEEFDQGSSDKEVFVLKLSPNSLKPEKVMELDQLGFFDLEKKVPVWVTINLSRLNSELKDKMQKEGLL
jgi:hypothetical protein